MKRRKVVKTGLIGLFLITSSLPAARADGGGGIFHRIYQRVHSALPQSAVPPQNVIGSEPGSTSSVAPNPVLAKATTVTFIPAPLPFILPQTQQMILPPPVLLGRNEAIIFGGADYDQKMVMGNGNLSVPAENIFQGSFISFIQAFKKNGWDVEPIFGNAPTCSGCGSTWDVNPIAKAAGKSPSDVPRASKVALITKLDEALQNLSDGDQLFIEINTHGGNTKRLPDGYDPKASWNEKMKALTDTVSLLVYDPEHPLRQGDMNIDDHDLTVRFQKLKNKGVKLAFGNDSCFGGSAVERLKQYGCVITSTSKGKEGAGSPVSDSLVDLLSRDPKTLAPVLMSPDRRVDLENVYLDVISKATQGVSSTDPVSGVPRPPLGHLLAPESSADMDQYDSIVDLGGKWLDQFKTDYLELKDGELLSTFVPIDLNVLANFYQKYGTAFLNPNDPTQDAHYEEVAKYYINRGNVSELGSDKIIAPSLLLQKIESASSDQQIRMQLAADQYNALSREESSFLSYIKQSGFHVEVNLPETIADARSAFNQALQKIDGQNINGNRCNLVSGWIMRPVAYGDQNGSHKQSFFEPSHVMFKTSVVYEVMDIVQFMSAKYPRAKSPEFQTQLVSAIIDAETRAWASASPEVRAAIQNAQTIEDKKSELLNYGEYFNEQVVSYITLARIYSYLAHHDHQVKRQDADLDLCQDFTLRTL